MWDTLAQTQLESEDLDGLERTGGFGLIAEDVEKVNPDLVVRDKQGKPYSVRYEQVNAMLLNEFLKEHRKVQGLEPALETLTARLNEHDAKIQRVSEQIEMKGSATRVADGQSLKPPCYPNGDNNKEWRALVRLLEISRTGTLALI
jgi:uncharacterized protein with von Willebrand factor type A (vWA) domain